MALTLVTAPVGLPVTVDNVKAQARITYSDAAQDELLSLYLQTAVNYATRRLARPLMTSTWKYCCDAFPCRGPLELPLAPATSVTHVKYVGDDGLQQVWDADEYVVDVASEPARLCPVFGGAWPVIQPTLNAVEVQFVAGYGNATSVPAEIKLAVIMLAAHYWENREATADVKLLSVPFAVDAQLDLHRWHPNAIATFI